MNPILLIALKNIKANKQRSIITIVLTMFSTVILIFSSTLMDGEHKIMLKNAVEIYPSYIQVMHKEFRDNPSLEHLIFDKEKVLNKLKLNSDIKLVSSRFETFALLSSKEKSIASMITGITPSNESKLSKLKDSLYKGEYLNDNDTNAIYLGNQLAKRLKVDIDDELSFVGTGADYSFCADILKVKGIFKTGLFEFDNNSVFLNNKYFDEVFSSSNMATSIIILPKDTQNSLQLSQNINKILNKDLVSQSWEEFMSALVKAMEVDSVFGYITLGVFFIVIFFVILIYTFLTLFSRIKEIGVLKAIGTSSKQIFKMLVVESVILSFISVLIGGIIGAYLAYYFSINPIELGAQYDEQFKQYGIMNTALPTDFNIVTILRDMFIIFMLAVLSTLYPIFKINKFTPVEAINHV